MERQTGGIVPPNTPGSDVVLRNYFESLRGSLVTARASWDSVYYQLSAFFLPKAQRFNYNSWNQGERQDYAIVDETGTLALRTLKAGMQSGLSNPIVPWFDLQAEDPKLKDNSEVKIYLQEVSRRVRASMIKSDVYGTLINSYGEAALYGTTCFLVLEDEKTDYVCLPCPVGSYYISGDNALRVDLVMRLVCKTVRQIVDMFGWENVSEACRNLYNSNAGGNKEQQWELVHVIHRNQYFGTTDDGKGLKKFKWHSTYYELNSYSGPNSDRGILAQSGFDECPFVVGRWDVVGENFYGYGAAYDILGTNMALQTISTRMLQGLDKQINPPMIGNPSMMGQFASVLPGDVTYTDLKDGGGFKPAYQVNFQMEVVREVIGDHRHRIESGLYKDLFLMISQDERSDITAEEIRAKLEEKMMVLGPVIHRSINEILEPLINRIISIMARRRRLPPMPQIMKGKHVRIDYVSVLARAQRQLELNNIKEVLSIAGSEEAVAVGAGVQIVDNFDLDKMTMGIAERGGMPAEFMRSPQQRDAIRAKREKAANAQAQADQAQKLTAAAGNLAQIPTGGGNVLSKVAPQLTGAPS